MSSCAEAVVACVRNAERVDRSSDRSDSFLDLAREALADERVSGDDYATGRLLYEYGSRLALTDRPAGAVRTGAGGGPVRACRPTIGRTRTVHQLARDQPTPDRRHDRHRGRRAGRAADIAEQAGDLDAVLELASNRVGDLLEERPGRARRWRFWRRRSGGRSTEMPATGQRVRWLLRLTDTYLWLLRLRDGVDAGRAGIARAVRDGLRESFDFSVLVTNTVECLLLLGETEDAGALGR